MLSRAILNSTRQLTPMVLSVRGSAQVGSAGVRDEVNFPRPKRNDPAKVRFGFIPDDWFLAFHKKTGVTGPYFFGAGLINYLCSKEWYVMEHEYYVGVSLVIMCVYVQKKFGPMISSYLNKEIDSYVDSLSEGRKAERDAYTENIEAEKLEQWRAEGNEMLVEAKKENVALQLEAAYRERLFTTYQEVKRRLDFQLEKTNLERRIAQKHMVSWIVNGVLKSITPDQEKQTLDKCIADLGALAARQ